MGWRCNKTCTVQKTKREREIWRKEHNRESQSKSNPPRAERQSQSPRTEALMNQ